MFLPPKPAASESFSAKPVYDSSGFASAGAGGPIAPLSKNVSAPAKATSRRAAAAALATFFVIEKSLPAGPIQAKVLYTAFKSLNALSCCSSRARRTRCPRLRAAAERCF